ncbi:fimbrial protein [Pseudomonas sp. ITA]|uniref:fimbrial protein n=1 Tax=Pseudomonas sp. ITA TaxID=2825841 RepID=UPI00249AB143|nr:fimbrial protein [Pseudomonas sp. ITA]
MTLLAVAMSFFIRLYMSRNYLLLFASLTCLLSTTQVYADDTGTITINGALKSPTCDAGINSGAADSTITLPSVPTSSLSTTAQVAGKTPFTINLMGCDPAGSVYAYFQNNQATINAAGRLSNMAAAAPAQFVELQLLNATNTAVNLSGAALSQNTGSAKVDTTGSAILNFSIQYYATQQATAGSVSSTLTYVINYI